jgi:rubrerythrin
MTTPKIFIVDAQTGEELVRDLNTDELKQLSKDVAEAEANHAAELAELTAKIDAAQKLVALGIDPKVFGLEVETSTK